MENQLIRLNKYISDSGMCSRREADKFIENRMVQINGRTAKIGAQVKATDHVTVSGNLIEPREKEHAVYIVFNKPVGVTCTTDSTDPDNIVDYISFGERIFPIGRLDKDSQGLIMLTSDGDIVNKILRAGNNHEKEYIVTVNKPFNDQFLKGMASGVPILGVNTKKCKIVQESPTVFRITLVQGLNRQIRRMCEHFGYTVTKLVRVRMMNINLNVPVGQYRELTSIEMDELNKAIKNSSSEDLKQKAKPKKPASSSGKKPATAAGPKSPGKKFHTKANGKSYGSKSKSTGRPSSRSKKR